MSDFEILVDCDAFVGLFFPDDAHHTTSFRLFEQFSQQRKKLVTTNYTVAETATVLSRHSGQMLARDFLDYIMSGLFPVVYVDQTIQKQAIALFRDQTNKSTSLFDCANVAVMRNLGIPTIFSFDHVYIKHFGLHAAQEGANV